MSRFTTDVTLEEVFGAPQAYDVDDGYNLVLGDGYVGGSANKRSLTTTPIEIQLEGGNTYRLDVDADALCEFIFVGHTSGSDPVTDDTGFRLVANQIEEFQVQQHRDVLSIRTASGTGTLRIHKLGVQSGHYRR